MILPFSEAPNAGTSLSNPHTTEMAGRAIVLTLLLSASSLAASRDILSDFGDELLCAVFGVECPDYETDYAPNASPKCALVASPGDLGAPESVPTASVSVGAVHPELSFLQFSLLCT